TLGDESGDDAAQRRRVLVEPDCVEMTALDHRIRHRGCLVLKAEKEKTLPHQARCPPRPSSSAVERARRVQFRAGEGCMRGWFFLGVAVFLMAAVMTILQSREDEEMFIRLGGRDLRSLPS